MANEMTLEAQFVDPGTGEPQFGVRLFPSPETDERLQESAAVMRKLRQSSVSLPLSALETELEPIQGRLDAVETIMLTLMGVDEEGTVQFDLNVLMSGGAVHKSDSAWFIRPRESRVEWDKLTGAPRQDDPITLPERRETIAADLWPDAEGASTPTHRLRVDVNDFLWRRVLGTIRTMCDLVQTEAHLELLDSETKLEPVDGASDAAAVAAEYRQRYLWLRLAEESTFELALKAFSETGPERDLVSARVL